VAAAQCEAGSRNRLTIGESPVLIGCLGSIWNQDGGLKCKLLKICANCLFSTLKPIN
jgi:hypothetical protein